jgi:hypothetical protein
MSQIEASGVSHSGEKGTDGALGDRRDMFTTRARYSPPSSTGTTLSNLLSRHSISTPLSSWSTGPRIITSLTISLSLSLSLSGSLSRQVYSSQHLSQFFVSWAHYHVESLKLALQFPCTTRPRLTHVQIGFSLARLNSHYVYHFSDRQAAFRTTRDS